MFMQRSIGQNDRELEGPDSDTPQRMVFFGRRATKGSASLRNLQVIKNN